MSNISEYLNNLKSRNHHIKNKLTLDNIRKNKNIEKFINKQNINRTIEVDTNNNNNHYNHHTININKNKISTNTSDNQINNLKDKNQGISTHLNTNATTIESTINSANSLITVKKTDNFYNESSKKNSLKTYDSSGGSKKKLKLKNPESEDMKFIYDIFYKYNNSNSYNLHDSNKKKNKFNFNELRKYLIKIEKNFKNEGNILIFQSRKASGVVIDFFFIKKLENLVARFSLIIFLFIKNQKLEQAKEIFLLMIKENKLYIDYIEKKIMEYYSITNKNINISKDYPRMTYEIIRIYSFIIKYSQFFNLMNYRNIFLGRYFELLFFIYNFFNHKGNNRCFNLETKNQLNYWFSFALHQVTYYSASFYSPMNLPINLSNYIIHTYNNFDDSNLTDLEESLMIKTYYNLGLFYYLDGNKDVALMELYKALERIINRDERDLAESLCHINLKKKESLNILVPKGKKIENNIFNSENLEEKTMNTILTDNLLAEKKRTSSKNLNNVNKKEGLNKEKGKNQINIIEKICEGFTKKQNNLEDIKLLISYGVKNGLITEVNKPENEYRQKFRKFFRGSHINLSTTFRMKDFIIPHYFNNPLLRKIELLMGEIEIDKKNYISAYAHILRAFYILISLKINRTSGNQKEFNNEQKIIDKYLTLIEKYRDEEIKRNKLLKSDYNFFENSDSKLNLYSFNNSLANNSINNSFGDSINENYREELNDIVIDKYNLDSDDSVEKNEDNDNQEILVYGKTEVDFKILKEIEKFFIFLNSLSLLQIKILNENQPNNIKRNDLPILFPSQFKDCLSNIQRIEFDNIQTMALSRFIVLKDPNKWILPNNININIINKNKLKPSENNKIIKFESDKELKYTPIKKTREYKYFQKIISSEKSNKEIFKFMNINFELIIKLLKHLSDEEIQNIINFPYMIIDPVKSYKKKEKKKLKKKGYNKDNKYKYDKYNYNYERDNNLRYGKNNYDYDDINNSHIKQRGRTFSTKFKKLNSHNFTTQKEIKRDLLQRFSARNRNRTVYSSFSSRIRELEEIQRIKDKRDYNDSYEDFLISPENSLDSKL